MNRFFRRKDIPYMILTALLGSVNHFLYDFSERNPFTALITPVNESTWEHLKLLFFPVLFFTAAQYYIMHPARSAFFASRFTGVCSGMAATVVLFYAYTGILGTHILLVDISIFLFSVCFTFYVSARLYRKFFGTDSMVTFFAWFILVLLFFIFTCYPPDFFLFFPPQA